MQSSGLHGSIHGVVEKDVLKLYPRLVQVAVLYPFERIASKVPYVSPLGVTRLLVSRLVRHEHGDRWLMRIWAMNEEMQKLPHVALLFPMTCNIYLKRRGSLRGQLAKVWSKLQELCPSTILCFLASHD